METARTFLSNQTNENTRSAYGYDISRWETFLAGRTPDKAMAMEFREHLAATVSNATAIRTFSTIRTLHEWLGSNLFIGVKGPKRMTDWSPKLPDLDDVNEMWYNAKTPRDRAIIALLMNGLRESEVADLDTDSIERHQGSVVVRVVGKGNRMRLTPLTSEAGDAVVSYARGKHGPLFLGRNKDRVTRKGIQYVVTKLSGDKLMPHALRHHYATSLLRNGADVSFVSKLLGHSRIETTQVYTHLSLDDLINTVNRYGSKEK